MARITAISHGRTQCQIMTGLYGNTVGKDPKIYRCKRKARYMLGDKLLCHQHAGEECLQILLKENPK